MHVLLGVLVLAILAFLVFRAVSTPSSPPAAVPAGRSNRGFAFLSNGLIFHRETGSDLKPLHSPYVEEAMERRERARERHSWKQGTSFNVAAGGGARSFEVGDTPIRATSAAFDITGDLLYFFKHESVGGLFRREAVTARELRVLLKTGLHLSDLAPSPDGSRVAASSLQSDQVANIALLDRDGSNYREVTGGDSVDSAPAWIPDAPGHLLFQSCGLARNEQGHIVAQGNATLQRLDMGSGNISTILEDAGYDYLKPRVSPAGHLLFIRRPYEAPRYGVSTLLGDTLLFPYRLLRAVFHYLNFFSLMYSRKPLTSASGPAVQADMKHILLQGRRIDTEKALRRPRLVQGVPSLVPDDWMLISRSQAGEERILASNVASYDISPDGTIVYSNGRGVFVLERDGTSRLAQTDELVLEVVAALA